MDLQAMDSLVKQLKCGICNNYLMLPPIVLLEDGASACGHCCALVTPKNCEGLMVREMALEKALEKLSFPCKFKSDGCQERLVFGYCNHKDEDCVYRPLICPTKECPWSGSMFGVEKHFAEAHSAMVKKALNFKLEVDQSFEETILAVIAKIPFVAKCVYNADQRQLYLQINCLTLDKAFYKISMCSREVVGNRVSLKKEMCLPYVSPACDEFTLNLEKYLPVFENPDCVMVSVQVMVAMAHGNNAVVPPNPVGNQPKAVIVPSYGKWGNVRFAAYLPFMPTAQTNRK